MTRKGRPKKGGSRYPCGKRTPSAREEEIVGVAVAGKLKALNLRADRRYPTFEDVKNSREGKTGRELAQKGAFGCPLNILEHWGYITANQAIAGHEFAQTLREYLGTAKLQKPTQGKAGFIPATPDNGDGPPVAGEARAKRYMDALADLDQQNRWEYKNQSTITSIMWRVCINEELCPPYERGPLRLGLNEIHRIMYGRKAA